MKVIRLLIVFTALAFVSHVSGQGMGDSLTIVRRHQQADSILRSINGGQPAATPVSPAVPPSHAIIDSPAAAPQAPVVPVTGNPGMSGDSMSGNQNHTLDSTRRNKWQGGNARMAGDSLSGNHYHTSDSSHRSGKWPAGNPPAGDVPAQGGPPGTAPAGYTGSKATGGPPSGMPAGMAGRMNIGHVFGKVIESQSKKPVGYCSVSLYTMGKDSLVTGQLTEDNGDFSFDGLPFGAYNLKVSFIGYADVRQKVVITMNKLEQDVGNIGIAATTASLKEVDVTGQKSTVELKVDRKIFNVGSDISARGGTGLDVMKNIPSVSIDADGNITLRNNTPQVYIDGKPTTLTLEQIPADQIDRVEVITNPSAKYEAASSGGIINVVMKRNSKPGYNGMINFGVATNTGYNGLAMINLKEKKFGVSLMYTLNGATNRTYGFNNRTNLDSLNQASGYTNQGINSTFKRDFQVARVAFDFFLNNRNTLSISENAVFGNFNTTDDINISGNSANGTEVNTQLNYFRNFTTDMSFKHTYPKEGKEYTLDVQYSHGHGGGNYLYNYDYLNANGSPEPSNPSNEYLNGGSTSDLVTFLGDFSLPIGKNMKIETGFRSNYKLTNSFNNVTNDTTMSSGSLSEQFGNVALSNNYRIDDLVNGAYITFTHMIKGFSYQLGLRVEQVYYKGTSYSNGDSSFAYQYPTDWGSVPKMLFPSFNISQKWGTKHEIQFNVARKSNRPNFFQIAPFIFSSNATTVQRGNPALQPEFVNQGEVNYNLSLSKVSWLTSIYVRYVQQPITGFLIAQTEPLPYISTYDNGTHSLTGGWENTVKIFPVKKLDVTLTGNVFYTDIVGGSTENNASNAGWSWLGKAIISYKLPMDITIQGNGTYEAPKILPQGKTTPMYYFDLSLSKDFMGFITLNLTVSDVLNSKVNGIDYYQGFVSYSNPGFIQDQSRRRDQRYAKLGVSFRFGKMDASLFKKKKPTQDQNGGGDIGF